MSQEETLRLAAEVVDRFSAPLKSMQRSLRALSDQVKGTHREGAARADEHTRALGDLHKRVHEVSERVRSGLEPAMAGLGLKYLSAAGAIAAVTAAVKNFATGARDLTYMSRQTGLAVNTLRYFQDTIAPKINSSAQTMSAGLEQFNVHMERLARNPLLERWTHFITSPTSAIASIRTFTTCFLSFIGRIRDQSQKKQFVDAFGLDPALTNVTPKELNTHQGIERAHRRAIGRP